MPRRVRDQIEVRVPGDFDHYKREQRDGYLRKSPQQKRVIREVPYRAMELEIVAIVSLRIPHRGRPFQLLERAAELFRLLLRPTLHRQAYGQRFPFQTQTEDLVDFLRRE